MDSYFETLVLDSAKSDNYRDFPETDIPDLANRLINGMEAEDPVSEILRESLTAGSEDILTLKITKRDLGDLLLALRRLVQYKEKLARTGDTLDGVIGMFKEAHQQFDCADSESDGLTAVRKMFGWRHKVPQNKERVFWEYIELIMGKGHLQSPDNPPPMSKTEAIDHLRKKYDFINHDAVCHLIERGIEEWKGAFGEQELKKLLPPDPEELKE